MRQSVIYNKLTHFIQITKQTKKRENMTTKTNKKTINLNDFGKWENQLPLYLDLYSKLTDEGKKEMKNQVSTLGKLVDIIQKAKNDKGVK